jgi:hypothetical protein
MDVKSDSGHVDVVSRMDKDKFHLLLDVLKIMEKHEDPNVIESALEIVESYNENMTQEQKAEVLKEVLHFKGHQHEEERERKFQEEWKKLQMREFFQPEYD